MNESIMNLCDVKLVDLGLPSGTLWADRNLGADAPEQYGAYFRWGETTPLSDNSGKYKFRNLAENIAGTEYDAATVVLGKKYRMPSQKQIEELLDHCKYMWTTKKNTYGILVTGPNDNNIFFPATGYRITSPSGSFFDVGKHALYWSATKFDTKYSHNLCFSRIVWNVWYCYHESCALGCTIRPVEEKS